jgi:hypothetical protein
LSLVPTASSLSLASPSSSSSASPVIILGVTIVIILGVTIVIILGVTIVIILGVTIVMVIVIAVAFAAFTGALPTAFAIVGQRVVNGDAQVAVHRHGHHDGQERGKAEPRQQ